MLTCRNVTVPVFDIVSRSVAGCVILSGNSLDCGLDYATQVFHSLKCSTVFTGQVYAKSDTWPELSHAEHQRAVGAHIHEHTDRAL